MALELSLGGDLDDWWATQVTITVVKLLESVPIPKAGEAPRTITGGVRLLRHAALSARARLSPASVASRDLGHLALPRLLRDDPAISSPFGLAATGGIHPGLSVLELTDVNDHTVVTPEAPLRLEVPSALAEGEYLVPVGYDGEFFLPLGRAGRRASGVTEVILDRLPAPVLHGMRSLSGSIRIIFQKVVCPVSGGGFSSPRLAAADVDEAEVVTYETDPARVRDRVARAERILLLIHGIVNTRELRRSLRWARIDDGRPLDALYDLVLTFDYEYLDTSIENLARSLQGRLAALGLGARHGKTLHVVAHSMGGLVARRFIEHEGGHEAVGKLVMLGTPNGGLPWSTLGDWATLTLSLGLNGLSAIAWPAGVLVDLVPAVEAIEVNLDQMRPGSPLLRDLAGVPDPGVPYVVLAGDTSIRPEALAPDPAADGTSLLGRLIASLRAQPGVHGRRLDLRPRAERPGGLGRQHAGGTAPADPRAGRPPGGVRSPELLPARGGIEGPRRRPGVRVAAPATRGSPGGSAAGNEASGGPGPGPSARRPVGPSARRPVGPSVWEVPCGPGRGSLWFNGSAAGSGPRRVAGWGDDA